jgi:hypothetical protein
MSEHCTIVPCSVSNSSCRIAPSSATKGFGSLYVADSYSDPFLPQANLKFALPTGVIGTNPYPELILIVQFPVFDVRLILH